MKIVGATGLGGLWALEWTWHSAETNLRSRKNAIVEYLDTRYSDKPRLSDTSYTAN